MSMSLVLSSCEMSKMISWSSPKVSGAEHVSLPHLQPLVSHHVSFNLTHPALSQHAFVKKKNSDGCLWSLIIRHLLEGI